MILKELKYHVFYRTPGKNIHLCSFLLDYTYLVRQQVELYILIHYCVRDKYFPSSRSPSNIYLYLDSAEYHTRSYECIAFTIMCVFCVRVHDDNASIFNFEGGLVFRKFEFVCTLPKL